jgi:hypothetical protein
MCTGSHAIVALMTLGRWWVEDFHDGFWLVGRSGWGEGADAWPQAEAIEPEAAASRVDAWFPEGFGDASDGAVLAAIAAALGAEVLWQSDTSATAWHKSVVRNALRDGRLIALRMRLPAPVRGMGEREEEARPAERVPREEKTWIEIVLVDDSDPPQPVPFQRYRIEPPGGTVREGMLDANGRAMITGIDPGTCEVTFPGLDARDWRHA